MNEMNSKYKFEDIEIIFIKGKKSQKKNVFIGLLALCARPF